MNTDTLSLVRRVNLRGLDSLRGLLAVYVLAGHGRWLLWVGWEAWRRVPHGALANALAISSAALRYGHEAVMVFFVLSGFFIHFNAAKALATATEAEFVPGDFFKRRVRRLVPPYLFALLFTVGLDLVGRHLYPPLYAGSTGDGLLDENFIRKGYGRAAVLPALVMMPDSLGWDFGSNGPLWSLAFEVVYYLLYPSWLWLRKRNVWAAYGVGAVCLTLSLQGFIITGTFPMSVLRDYPVWLAGAGLAEVLCVYSLRLWVIPVAGCAALAVLASLSMHVPSILTVALYIVGGTATVLMFAGLPDAVSGWRISRLWELLGICSYSIYICHFPVLSLLSASAFRAFGSRPFSGWLAAAGSSGAILLCVGCFLVCERPFLPRRRQRALVMSSAVGHTT